MQIIENNKVKEKLYIEHLNNGMTFMFIPKKNTRKKYVIWGTHYGSIDNKFIVPGENEVTEVPNGVAHFLEHKMFEQENKPNSLDVLTALGVEANAYTTNDHTAYLYECTDNFYEALDELMDYFQHPYFTDKNVEKEKGIIDQEIRMYEDYPEWKVYLNAIENMYKVHPIRIDITGTSETISHINKEILYGCYRTFYHPSNTTMVICGDFEPDVILNEVKKRLLPRENQSEIKRIQTKEPDEIMQKESSQKMEVSIPLFAIGFKDKIPGNDIIKRHIAIEILMGIIIGKSSKLYQELYDEELLREEPDLDYEFSTEYAHILIIGQSNSPKKVEAALLKEIKNLKQNGINLEDFERNKKKIYGGYIKEYNDVAEISKMFLADYFKGINSFDYLENFDNVTKEYAEEVLREAFDENKQVLSMVVEK